MIKCILLSAGYGTRLRPITNNIPKCLVQVKKKPILIHWVEFLKKNDVDKILINTHYMPEKVEECIRVNHFLDFVDLVHEKQLLGTAKTIAQNSIFLEKASFFVAHVDNYTTFNFKDFLSFHNNRSKDIIGTMMTFKVNKPELYGIVEQSNNNILTNFFEKKKEIKSKLANAAIYIFEPEVISIIKKIKKKKIDISLDLIPRLINKIQLYENKEFVIDIGTKKGLDLANKTIKGF